MIPQVDCQNKRVLARVSPIAHFHIGFVDHHVDEGSQQGFDVARHTGLDTLALNPCILDCIVQLRDILRLRPEEKVGVLAVQ